MSKDIKYLAKDGFMARKIAGELLLIPVGERTQELNGMVTLNDTGMFIWECLSEPKSEAELIEMIMEEFDVLKEKVEIDVRAFIRNGLDEGMIIRL